MIVDFYRGVIQDRSSTTVSEGLHSETESRQSHGRRDGANLAHHAHDDPARHDAAAAVARDAGRARAGAVASQRLVARYRSVLVERGSTTVTTQLTALATGNALPRAKVKALWVLDGNDSIDVATLTTALADPSRDVRMNAVRIAERWLGDVNHPIHAAVLKLIDDPDWNVRQQLAASLGAMPPSRRQRLWRRCCRNTRTIRS